MRDDSERGRTVLRLHAEALASFGRRVHGVACNQWVAGTPCRAWSVRNLVDHLTTEQLWAPELLAGRTIAEVGSRFDGDVLGEDPVAAWTAAAAAARAAFNAPGALDRTVQLSYGVTSALDYCAEMTIDAAVHTWDLARASGGDAHLAPELVEFALDRLVPHTAELEASGLFDPPLETSPDADPLTRLLALLGRRAGGRPALDPEQTG
ncbi:TIGR03086 family metal-binding protein [Kitasatospora sp. NPDC052896]|uniref:TIGR03086 family metal-binding protein n=1 Tax=Kitasatospora sp. NPDC052896 TaxID=3364061 RepID=UPI0037CA1651